MQAQAAIPRLGNRGAHVLGIDDGVAELAVRLVKEWLSYEFDESSASAEKVAVISGYEAEAGHAVEKAVRQSVRQRPRKRSNKRHAQTRSQTDNDSGNLCWFFPVCRPTATGECFRVMSCTDPRTMVPSPS